MTFLTIVEDWYRNGNLPHRGKQISESQHESKETMEFEGKKMPYVDNDFGD